ncbi:hypothetical protein F5Y08DRAFT_39755 [Xylaria arbuscula]|nr:hypothetical protein F5Y08DRAFT_39755 [Xylaria arbuscula]
MCLPSVRASSNQHADASYQALSHWQEDNHNEHYSSTDYQYFRDSTIHDVPHIPQVAQLSWDRKASSTTRVEPVAVDGIHQESKSGFSETKATWLPYTLRWYCLALIIAFTAVLEIAVVVVHVISARQKGIVADDGSGIITILSKFIPTLLAVIHGILLSILLIDVKRTQPFANLASPAGASAKQSLSWIADAWWESLFASLPKSRVKKTNWALLCATVAFIFCFLLLSPFSSTLLVSQDVLFVEERAFSQLDISSALPLQADALGTTYFRTVGSLLQNVTTSAWITDHRAVLPFWPSTIGSAPLGPIISDSAQTWSARTTVFDVEMECDQMNLVEFVTIQLDPKEHPLNLAHRARLLSPSGCDLNLTVEEGEDLSSFGGAVWSNLRGFNGTNIGFVFDTPSNVSGCTQDEIILLSGYLPEATFANATFTGQVCKTSYYMGNPNVAVTLSNSATLLEIDESEYLSIRKPIPSTFANVTSFQHVFLNNTNWEVHLKKPLKSTRPYAFAPAIMLSAIYDLSVEKMVADPSFTQTAGRVKQRFFGELLRDVFDTASGSDAIKTTGIVTDTRRRVVVVPSAAIIIEISLFLQLLLLSTVFITTRISKRPLGLFADPAPPLRVAKLISNEAGTLQSLKGLHGTSPRELEHLLSNKRYQLSQGQISLVADEGPEDIIDMASSQEQESQGHGLQSSTFPKQQALTLSIWVFLLLIFLLAAVLTVIAYLYWYSDTVGLYQTAFIYAFDISVGGLDLGAVNPASLITTLVAVIIGLWWGSLDTALRKIQPYLILAKTPSTQLRSEAVSISYISSYLLWGAWRALKRRHWVLALVCTGAFLSEILTIVMSSLWTRAGGSLPHAVNVSRQLELRQVPQVSAGVEQFTSHAGNYKQTVISDLFDSMRTSWIYGAAVQTSLNGLEPPWSSRGWSFIPYDLSMVPNTTLQHTRDEVLIPKYSTNATIDTSAIRARLECSPYEYLDLEDSRFWLTEWDLTNTSRWARDMNAVSMSRGFELGLTDDYDNIGKENVLLYLDQEPDLEGNYTTFFVNNKRFQCCENKTNGQIDSGSVGYWSPNLRNGSFYPDFAGTWPANFTVKWIHGTPVEGYCRNDTKFECEPALMWADRPRMAALNCMPIIETADATVTVDASDGNVVDFVIRGEPQPDEYAWSEDFTKHKYNDSSGFDINITTSHGILFVTALLGAADLDEVQGTDLNNRITESESLEDQTFNIRQPGLNVDLMTYSMLSLVNYDHEALLDLETLQRTAQQTFTALFQNYASTNVSFGNGGYVFQPLEEKLPADLDGPVKRSSRADTAPANGTVVMHIARPVELLKISKTAAWICLSILAYLIVVGVILTIASWRYYSSLLLRRINSIADVAVLMAGSERLLGLARETAVNKMKLDAGTRVRLGWFNDTNGTTRWGIEVVGEEQSGTKEIPLKTSVSHPKNNNLAYFMASAGTSFTSISQREVEASSSRTSLVDVDLEERQPVHAFARNTHPKPSSSERDVLMPR